MGSEIINAVTIYEVNGRNYTGATKLYVKSHPRFLSFVRLCIDNQEYSLASDELMRAVGNATRQLVAPEDAALVDGAFSSMKKFVEESVAEAPQKSAELPPR